MPAKTVRLLVIGMDGADYLLMRHLLDRGRLPNLQGIAERGAWGPLRSTIPPNTPPAWSTMFTGKNPGKHAIFDWLPMTGEPSVEPVASRRAARSVWQALGDAGFTVGTINLPVTYPPEPLTGFQVAGLDAPGFEPSMAHPRAAFEVLKREVGEYEVFAPSIQRPGGDEEALQRHADMPLKALCALLKAIPCDVCMTSFQIVDWVQHGALGREMEAEKPESLDLDGMVAHAYRLVDERIGALLAQWCADETIVVVISDHGGTAADRLVNLEKVFLEAGLMAYRTTDGSPQARLDARRSRAALALRAWSWLKRSVPAVARLLAAPARQMRGWFASYREVAELDWSRTVAVPWGEYAQVRINVRGREAHGAVEPSDYDDALQRVREVMLSLTDPVTGERIYSQVLRGTDVHSGPYAEIAPDLYALPAQHRYCTLSARTGMTALPLLDVQPEPVAALDPPWGVHSPLGVMLLAGPGVKAGVRLQDASLEDFVPTALHLLGQPIPEDLDGRVLVGALDRAPAGAQRAFCEPWPPPERIGTEGYSEAERAAVEERLRRLGYL